MRQTKETGRRSAALLVGVVLGTLLACAYYNMLYNAKARFAEAEKVPAGRDGKPNVTAISMYDEVIEKCRKVIQDYPDSRWVDDAMLLIARAYFHQEKYNDAIKEVDSLQTRFPKSELMKDAVLIKGRSYALTDRDEEAVHVFAPYLQTYPGGDAEPEVLFFLVKSSMTLGEEDKALEYLQRLVEKHPDSRFRYEADIEIGEVLLANGQYERSLEVYQRLMSQRIPSANRYRVWIHLAEVDVQLGRNAEALEVLARLDELPIDDDAEKKSSVMFLRGKTLVAIDSLDAAIGVYKDIGSRFRRSKYSAEAFFRLGAIYQERLDSLATAKNQFDRVPRQYAKSDFADEAIKRSSNIAKLIRLRESEDSDDPDAKAAREFSMAEIELFQFNDTKKALAGYQKLLDEFPDSELAPRAAYAIGYIHGIVLGDSLGALEWYTFLKRRYPDSQQAQLAYQFYPPARDTSEIPPGLPEEGAQ